MSKPRAILRDVDRAMIQAVMFQMGIIPMENTNFDIRRPLVQLSAEEQRVFKRKFRKLWRKAMRAQLGNSKFAKSREAQTKNSLGLGKHVPSRSQKNARKRIVFDMLWNDSIEPLIKNFENAGKAKEKAEKTEK